MVVVLSKENYEKIISHAKKEFPYECCGLLGGKKKEGLILIREIYAVKNVDQSSEHFSMDPKEQFAVVKQMRKEGLELLGNYHSHPYTPSRPSEEDKRLAFDAEAVYGILSLEKEEPVFNIFKIDKNKNVAKLEVEIV